MFHVSSSVLLSEFTKVNWVVEIYGPSPRMGRLGSAPLHLPDFLIWRSVTSPCCEIFFILCSFYLYPETFKNPSLFLPSP